MTIYWNVGPYTYHVELDFEKNKAKISKHDGDGKQEGRAYSVSLEQYSNCHSRFDVEELYKSKSKTK